jgi:exopolysaccharide production protein ExoY
MNGFYRSLPNFYNIPTIGLAPSLLVSGSWITTLLQGLNTLHRKLHYLEDVRSLDIGSAAFDLSPVQSHAAIWRAVRIGERLIAGALLVLTLPILTLASIILVAISRQSPLVAHERVGHCGRAIWVLKLRTMWKGSSGNRSIFVHRLSACEAPLLAPKIKNALVTSRFAAFCRRYSLDELPQLWHVVRGDMALVGPRPLTRQELDTYYGSDTARVVSAKPGISGLWQISGRSQLTYPQRRRLDLFLVRKWSISLYLKILLVTLPRVLAGKDAW